MVALRRYLPANDHVDPGCQLPHGAKILGGGAGQRVASVSDYQNIVAAVKGGNGQSWPVRSTW